MRLVTVEAAQTLVNAGWRAVVAAAKPSEGVGCVTLHAKPLARIGRYLHGLLTLPDGRFREHAARKVRLFVTNKELRGSGNRGGRVDLVTRQAGNGRLGALGWILQRPGTVNIERGYQVLDVPLEEHAMAAEAIRGKLLGLVVRRVEEDVSYRWRSVRRPANRRRCGSGTTGNRRGSPASGLLRAGWSCQGCRRSAARGGSRASAGRARQASASRHGTRGNAPRSAPSWTSRNGSRSFHGMRRRCSLGCRNDNRSCCLRRRLAGETEAQPASVRTKMSRGLFLIGTCSLSSRT